MAPVPSPSRPARGRLRRGVLRWGRRPALAVTLLAVAVAVSVAHGQPSPADRASGVSVPVRTDTPVPPQIGSVVLVAGSGVFRFNTDTRRQVVLPLPPRVAALQIWNVTGLNVVLGRLPYRSPSSRPAEDRPGEWSPAGEPPATAAWIVRVGHPPVPLGRTETVTPSVDGRAVWLVNAGVATRVALRHDQPRVTVRLPKASRLVADTPSGLIVTTGTVLTREEAAAHPTATPTGTPTSPGGSATATATTRPAGPTGQPTPTTSPTPTGTPLATILVRRGLPPRLLAEAQALAAFDDVVLVRRADERLGVFTLRSASKLPRWLPNLSAVEVTGPASIDYDGATFAVLARVNEHVRLMVGPVNATTEAEINVVALEGGPPGPDATPPAFTASGRVLAVRPDGKVVYYLPGNRSGVLLGADLPPAAAVIEG
ncbi:MAG: hypothetical protein V7637_5890 [Mycobacteriales bacterium]